MYFSLCENSRRVTGPIVNRVWSQREQPADSHGKGQEEPWQTLGRETPADRNRPAVGQRRLVAYAKHTTGPTKGATSVTYDFPRLAIPHERKSRVPPFWPSPETSAICSRVPEGNHLPVFPQTWRRQPNRGRIFFDFVLLPFSLLLTILLNSICSIFIGHSAPVLSSAYDNAPPVWRMFGSILIRPSLPSPSVRWWATISRQGRTVPVTSH